MIPIVSGLLNAGQRCSRHVATLLRVASLSAPAARSCVGTDPQRHGISNWASVFGYGSESPAASGTQVVGLFGRPELTRPEDWQRLADDTEGRCDMLLAEVLDTTPDDGVEVVALIDEMSDQLCRTYDAAECCRNVHSDPVWRQAAGRVCVQLGEYIARVNHHEGMYRRLSEALAAYESSLAALQKRETPRLGPRQLAGWCAESVLVAQRLKQDMEQGGIHLPSPEQRARLAELAAANGHFAAAFNQALTEPSRVGRARLGLGRSVSLEPSNVAAVMAAEAHESVRRQVYLAAGSSPACNRRLLEDMVAVRRELAQMQGFPSYSALRMANGSLARSPSAVVAFLQQLAAEVRPLAERELRELAQLKAFDTRGGPPSTSSPSSPPPIEPWDVEYYAARARQHLITSPPTAVYRYTSLPSVLTGVRHLLRRVFRMELRVAEAAPGEGWAPGVLRCEAVHSELGPLGTVYLDLGDRPGKYPSAVTFPITCGRELPPSRGGGGRQLPVMALLASASGTCPASGQPALTYRELRVLLHELGHCCHNLLSRTKYQHLWGTRCAQDLVEVPSHLFEYFAADPRAMGLLARDRSGCAAGAGGGYEDGEPMPEGLLRELLAGRSATAALELQQQLVISLADQWLFGERPPGSSGDGREAEAGGATTSDVWRQAVHVASSLPYVPGTSPELRIGHFTVYGGSYYGYVYARCLAAQLWSITGLEEAPLDPGPGNLVRERLLAPGGSLAPLDLFAGLVVGRASISLLTNDPAAAVAAADAAPGAVAAARRRRLEPWQLARLRQRGLDRALGPAAAGGFLQALEGGYAPRPEKYLEMIRGGRGAAA